jgi:hypothetical protein
MARLGREQVLGYISPGDVKGQCGDKGRFCFIDGAYLGGFEKRKRQRIFYRGRNGS